MDQNEQGQSAYILPNQLVQEEEKKGAATSKANTLLSFDTQKDYTQKNVMTRWEEERAKWLKVPDTQQKSVQPKIKQPNEEGGTSLASFINKRDYNAEQQAKTFQNDVRGDIESRELPEEDSDSERRAVRKIMKSQSGPYQKFDAYYALEDIIDLYMEIWYDSDSSSN